MPQLFSALRVLGRHTVMKSALVGRLGARAWPGRCSIRHPESLILCPGWMADIALRSPRLLGSLRVNVSLREWLRPQSERRSISPVNRNDRPAKPRRASTACVSGGGAGGNLPGWVRPALERHRNNPRLNRKYERIDLLRPVREANWRRRWETSSPLRVSRGSSASQRLRPRSSK